MQSRSDQDALLDSSVENIRAVSAGRARILAKLGVRTVRDLLSNYPHRYIDLSKVASAASAPLGEVVTVVGTVDEIREKQPRPRLNILEVAVVDQTGVIIGVWFRQPWMAKRFQRGMRVALSGKVTFDYGFKRMNSPFVEFLGEDGSNRFTPQLVPVHPTTEGLSTSWMRRLVANALEQTSDISDPLPPELVRARGLMSKKLALRWLHFPHTHAQRDRARYRLAYEELLCLQLEMMQRRRAEAGEAHPIVHEAGAKTAALREALPFELTDEQQAAVQAISDDMCAPRTMNRMLLGDVGTGKTAVAAFALALAADSGHQAAMMAPTEVLARQYAEKLGPLFDACSITWGILTGSTPAEDRSDLLERLQSGELEVLFGTHALIEPTVVFSDLSLVVIDEQHRFGVRQRSALRLKGPGSDLLVMTATPIPRTLALALYGDLSTSYIRKRPASRPPVTTEVISRNARGRAYDAIRNAVNEGRQAYIICPLVGVSREQRAKSAESGELRASLFSGRDIADPKAAEQEAAYLADKVFPGMSVGLLTGHMSSAEKQRAMNDFNSGATSVLVATTVVEVGIDVPNATVMMVEDAERFGISQLHQLRGRVGRGEYPGQVFLVADPGKDDDELKARLDALVNSTDGFELAEADLRARHEGDVLGLTQHGASTLKLVNVIDDASLIETANADAHFLLEGDPDLSAPEHERLSHEIEVLFSGYEQDEVRGA
ncbi:MAG: ATP-dependent DNA helicase RecG [Coriobacteriales bacterium]|jgi:ATP-dependent DNA helicase RecG